MFRFNFCLPSRHFGIALILLGLMILLTHSGAGSPAATAPFAYDSRTDRWRVDLGNAPAAPTEAHSTTPLPLASLPQEPEIKPGCEWGFTPNISPHPEVTGEHTWPDLAVLSDGSVAVIWMDNHALGYHIFYSTSHDGGATWSPPEQVDTRTAGESSRFPRLGLTPAGLPVVVWEDDRTGDRNVYMSRRDRAQGGDPWTANVQINTAGSPPFADWVMNPTLTILDESRMFVAWTDWREGSFNQVYMRGSADGGATWGPETRISDGLGYQPVASDPCLLVDPASGPNPGEEILDCVTNDWRGNVPGGRYPNVFFYHSSDGGQTWTTGVQVNDIEPFYQQCTQHAMVRLDDGTLTAAWFHWTGGPAHFRTAVSTDHGQTWSASTQGDPSGVASGASIRAVDGWVLATFAVREGDLNAYIRASADGGRTWVEPPCRMDDAAAGDANGPVLAARSPHEVYAAWWDNRPGLAPWKIFTAHGTRVTTGLDPEGQSPAAPAGPALVCLPNPSSRSDAVHIRIGRSGGQLRIFDCVGRCVRTLPANASVATWDGADAAGSPVAPGVYWVTSEQEAGSRAPASARIVRLR